MIRATRHRSDSVPHELPFQVDEGEVQRIDAYLEEHQHLRQGNKVLHGYPPPLLWRRRDVPVAEIMAQRQSTAARIPKQLIVYVATPYCLPTEPARCGFCLFPSEVYRSRSQLDEYLRFLAIEGELLAPYVLGSQLGGVYFGGGTANLYLPHHYQRLTEELRRAVGEIPPEVEVTLEGVPQLFTRDKLAAMQAAGINRVSIGAQQLDDEMIRLSGRRQSADQVFRTIGWCRELGLSCSVDLIFGWPRQTVGRMLSDLRAIAAAGIAHLTHYELNVAGRSAFARGRQHELPSREENLEMYREAKRFLESAGYRQRTAYDWELRAAEPKGNYRFEETWHRPLGSAESGLMSGVDMWGWGFAGVSSHLGAPDAPGWTFLNHTRTKDYFASLAAGRFPVERGYAYDRRSLRLNVLFQMLHGLEVDLAEIHRLFGTDLLAEHAETWCALIRRGWVVLEDERLHLVGDGVFHTPLIQSLLARQQTAPRAA